MEEEGKVREIRKIIHCSDSDYRVDRWHCEKSIEPDEGKDAAIR